MSEQSEIHDLTFSETSDKRIRAAKQLVASFNVFSDRRQALDDLLRLCSDRVSAVREEAINSIAEVFPYIQGKEQVWERLINLTAYPEEKVIRAAVNALVSAFNFMPDRNKAWEDLFELVNSESGLEDVSSGIVKAFPYLIPKVPDKHLVSKDLLKIIASNDHNTREQAVSFFCMVFPELSYAEKEKLWDKLLELTTDSGDMKVREQAVRVLGAIFSDIPYEMRDEALDELLELAVSESSEIQKEVLLALPSVISHITDKERIWKDIFRLTGDESGYVRRKAADTLVSIFPDVPNKQTVWNDFLNLTRTKDDYVRNTAADALELVFPYMDNKDLVWKELIKLTEGKDENVRGKAANTLDMVFPYISDKNKVYSDLEILANNRDNDSLRELVTKLAADYPQFYDEYVRIWGKREEMKDEKEMRDDSVSKKDKPGIHELSSENWSDVLKMAEDRDTGIRRNAADLLTRIFPDVKEKPGVFFDLIKLTESQDAQIREKAAKLFLTAFKYSDAKQRAWNELVRLASVEDRKVRREAILVLSSVYAEVPDKDKGWKDLVRLTDHSDNFVKRTATRALGQAFFNAPDKTEAWRDLHKVTVNPYTYVRKYAFQDLGKASLWRSLRAENETTYIFGIREAVKFFKEANEVPTDTKMPDFYQPFYEALLSVLFSEIPGIAKIESERYVTKLSHEIRLFGDSQQFHEIVKQLSGILKDAGDLPPGDLSAQKKLLETSIIAFEKFSYFFEIKEEESISSPKTAKKEHPNPGKEILERVERRKSFLSKRI